jgi:hypothetical protein
MPYIFTRGFPSALCAGALALVACSLHAQNEPKPLPPVPTLPTGSLTGQTIAVLPITLIAADPAVDTTAAYASYKDRRPALLRTDSLIGEALQTRGPEVHWVLPPQLRKIARRSAGFVDDPDQMGQAVLRSPKMTKVPDPLRSSLRGMVALVDSRLALVPASLGFSAEPNGGIRADLTLVLADARSGKILWRSVAYGRGKSPDQALNASISAVLPLSGEP